MKKDHIIFELHGKSLEMAKKLNAYVDQFYTLKKAQIRNAYKEKGGSLTYAESQALYQNLNAELMAKLTTDLPESFAILGTTHAEICVIEREDCFPRAYREFPQLYFNHGTNPRFFIYAPIGYQGVYFIPPDARAITDEKELKAVNAMLHAGGWVSNPPLLPAEREGIALPIDFIPNPEAAIDHNPYKHHFGHSYFFIAKGDSLIVADHYLKAQARFKNAVDQVLAVIEELMLPLKDALLKTLDADDELYLNKSYQMQNKPEISISLCSKKLGGKQLPIPENPYFNAVHNNISGYAITPKRDTAEGQIFALAYDNIPPLPDPKDYPELICDGQGPSNIINRFGHHVIIYNFAERRCIINPPKGAIQIPLPVHNWLMQNDSDRSCGTKPPPPPAEVVAFLQSLQDAPSAQATRPQARSAPIKKPKL
jgi:hypothetical protein